ncbi:protein FAM177A1 isoform X2 [Brienomyrus brachyistius]|nr:protein FAM177A1 isoform X2 [Brienomyrus brachyistius]
MTGSIPSSPGQKRVIHFVSGETLEEESSDEEELFDEPVNTAQLSWRAYSRLLWRQFRRKSLRTCDYVGGKLASLAGLNEAKYQYAADEHERWKEKLSRRESTAGGSSIMNKEKTHFSSQTTACYGTTGSPVEPCHLHSVVNTDHILEGSCNRGYQEDKQ